MSGFLKNLFSKNKTASSTELSASQIARKEKLIAEREKLTHELQDTKIVSTNKREEMLDRINEINKVLRREFNAR